VSVNNEKSYPYYGVGTADGTLAIGGDSSAIGVWPTPTLGQAAVHMSQTVSVTLAADDAWMICGSHEFSVTRVDLQLHPFSSINCPLSGTYSMIALLVRRDGDLLELVEVGWHHRRVLAEYRLFSETSAVGVEVSAAFYGHNARHTASLYPVRVGA